MSILLLVLLPLFGFLINSTYHLVSIKNAKTPSSFISGWIATLSMLGAFLIAVVHFLKLKAMGPSPVIEEFVFSWIRLDTLSVDYAFRFDSLSSVFTLVITGVGSLIHLYSIGYMSDDQGVAKYFAYLNLFCFMMLNLVLGSTLLQTFLGWEGVGLASYLLIGFWYQDFEKVLAGQKAFIMNRIGDLGFLIAMFIGFKFVGSLDLITLSKATLAPAVATTFGLLIFLACTGKSAQIPLFTWLPDAMAGPTPVSALIHAATMVTSGIYLLSRLSPVISSSETVMTVIAFTGALTALMAAVNACFQTDIKKILAYSTISQLGFMFVACGVGAFEGGVFHVMTHAFFKALLFLGAGSVIHALHGGQDIFKMGGLRKALPVTFWTFTLGWAAILGLPPFSGFFSKDEIIFQSISSPHGNKLVFAALLISALLTAFYMTRLYVLVFFGETRLSKKEVSHLHESPWIMGAPLAILGVASLVSGWFGAPVKIAGPEGAGVSESLIMAISVVVAVTGASLAWVKYKKITSVEGTSDPFQIDRLYGVVFGRGTIKVSQWAGKYIEEAIVQRVMQVAGAIVDLSGNMLRAVQIGSAQAYLLMIVFAIIAMVSWMLFGVTGYGKF